MTRDRGAAIDAALVGLVAIAVHARSIGFGFVDLDDRDLILDDQAFLAQPSSLWRVFGRAYMHVVDAGHAYYRPVVTWTYALDAQWSGTRPVGYHLTNVALWAGAALVVWGLLRSIGLGRALAVTGALVFAVHPTLVPAAAWIPGRNDSLLCVLGVGAWIALLRRRMALHLVLFGLALLTKETAVALPLVYAAHAGLLEPELRRPRVLGGFSVGWTVLVLARVLVHPPDVGPTLANLPLLVGSLGELVLPVHLSPIAVAQDVPWWPGVVAAVALASATWLVPGVRKRVVLLGAVTFVALLVPSLLLPGSLVLDQRLTLPAVGVVVMLGEIVRALAPEGRMVLAFGGVAAAVLGAVSVAYEGAFRDARAFARGAVEGSPHSAMAHFCLGQSYQRAGDDDRALAEYLAALALGPAEVVHNNLAVIYMRRAQWPEAESELRGEIAVNPRYARAYFNLGIVLRREGRSAEGCASETTALELQPDDPATRQERDRDCAEQ